MKPKSKKKPRKPRAWKMSGFYTPKAFVGDAGLTGVFVIDEWVYGTDIRRLADWLTKAADYLESK
jgi:hypothetical protein